MAHGVLNACWLMWHVARNTRAARPRANQTHNAALYRPGWRQRIAFNAVCVWNMVTEKQQFLSPGGTKQLI